VWISQTKHHPEAMEPAQGHVRNRFTCSSPANGKRSKACLAESGQDDAGRKDQRGNADARGGSAKEDDGGREEEDSKPSLVSISATQISSDTAQEAVQEAAASTPDAYLPPDWTFLSLNRTGTLSRIE
jgi:hypothetical protein